MPPLGPVTLQAQGGAGASASASRRMSTCTSGLCSTHCSHDLRSHLHGKAFHGLQQAVRRWTREIDAKILDAHGLILANTLDDTLRTATEEARARSFRELDGGAEGDRDRLRVASASRGQLAQGGDFLAQLLGWQIGRWTLHDRLPAG